MSIYTDAQTDAAALAKLVNEDADVTTRYGDNPKKSGPKAIREFEEKGEAAITAKKADFDLVIDQYKESRGFTTKGTFADGFTYELPNDVGLDADGNPWIYNGTLPFTVTAGTTPTNPTYTQVVYGNAAQVSTNTSDTVQSFVDSFALKIFQSPTDGGLTEIQTRTVDANEVYEVRKTADDSLATIYSDAAGTTEIVQNGTDNLSGGDGVVTFYVDGGDYYVEVNSVQSNFSVDFLRQDLANSDKGASLVAFNRDLNYTKNSVGSQLNADLLASSATDFVSLASTRVNAKKLRFSRVSAPYDAIRVALLDDRKHVSYEIRKNTNDDWWIFHTAFSGNTKTIVNQSVNMDTRTGVWTGPDGTNNIWTTEVGATFTFTIKGEQIEVHHLSDTRGGLFEAVIDGDTQKPVRYSTWGDTGLIVAKVIAAGLDDVEHTVVCTFLGADPDNPPSSSPARGWAMDDYADVNPIRYTASAGIAFAGGHGENTLMLGYASNKELAINITHNGQTKWFPEHNNLGTAFSEPPRIIYDGKEISLSDLVVDKIYSADRFEFIQKAVGRIDGVTDVLDCECNFTVNRTDGAFSVAGSIEFLEDCIVNDGYSMMFPLVQDQMKEVITGFGTRYQATGDGSIVYFPLEEDRCFSYCGVDERNPDMLVSMRVDSPRQTMRYGESGRQSLDRFAFLFNSPAYPKLYLHSFLNAPILGGYKYRFSGQYLVAKIAGAHKFVG